MNLASRTAAAGRLDQQRRSCDSPRGPGAARPCPHRPGEADRGLPQPRIRLRLPDHEHRAEVASPGQRRPDHGPVARGPASRGRIEAWAGPVGVSFIPSRPFAPLEKVTVTSRSHPSTGPRRLLLILVQDRRVPAGNLGPTRSARPRGEPPAPRRPTRHCDSKCRRSSSTRTAGQIQRARSSMPPRGPAARPFSTPMATLVWCRPGLRITGTPGPGLQRPPDHLVASRHLRQARHQQVRDGQPPLQGLPPASEGNDFQGDRMSST